MSARVDIRGKKCRKQKSLADKRGDQSVQEWVHFLTHFQSHFQSDPIHKKRFASLRNPFYLLEINLKLWFY